MRQIGRASFETLYCWAIANGPKFVPSEVEEGLEKVSREPRRVDGNFQSSYGMLETLITGSKMPFASVFTNFPETECQIYFYIRELQPLWRACGGRIIQ